MTDNFHSKGINQMTIAVAHNVCQIETNSLAPEPDEPKTTEPGRGH